MGIGGISIWQLLIILAIVVMIFGTRRLRNLGSDLGGALKGFRSAMKEDDGDGGQAQEDTEEGAKGDAKESAKECAGQDASGGGKATVAGTAAAAQATASAGEGGGTGGGSSGNGTETKD